jgi:lipid-A-disaccharide synthase
MTEILLVSGEASGDVHGANLIRQLKLIRPDIQYTAVGSDKMRGEGASILFDIKKLSVMGIVEVIKKIPIIFFLFSKIEKYVQASKPALAILIDAPDFNLRLVKRIKKGNVKIVYYISPTIWAWRYNRVNTIKKYVDKMLVILPFEEDLYKKENVSVSYVGHPLLDELSGYIPDKPKEFADKNNFNIAIFPGSRKFEILLLLKPLLEASALIREKFPKVNFIIPRAKTISREFLAAKLQRSDIIISEDSTKKVLQYCDVAIVKSGTSTLETGLMAVPMVIVYKFSWLTYFIGKYIVRIKQQPFGLVNIIAQRPIVKELFQQEVTGQNIAEEVIRFLTDKRYYDAASRELFELKTILTHKEASKNAAKEVNDLL